MEMNRENMVERLTQLAQLEIDANYTYQLVIDKIDDEVMRDRLGFFEEQHQAHIERLSEEITELGGRPPDLSPNIKGYLIGAVTTLMSTAGDTGALQALKLVEEQTTDQYQTALKWEATDRVREIVKRHFSDEKIHLDYLTNNLKALRR